MGIPDLKNTITTVSFETYQLRIVHENDINSLRYILLNI